MDILTYLYIYIYLYVYIERETRCYSSVCVNLFIHDAGSFVDVSTHMFVYTYIITRWGSARLDEEDGAQPDSMNKMGPSPTR